MIFKRIVVFIIVIIAIAVLSVVSFVIKKRPSNDWKSVIKQIAIYLVVIAIICLIVYLSVKFIG